MRQRDREAAAPAARERSRAGPLTVCSVIISIGTTRRPLASKFFAWVFQYSTTVSGAMTTALRRCRFTNTSTTFIRSLSRTAVAMTPQARFADGSDEASLTNELNKLTAAGWALTDSGQGIERSFKFKTFAKTWVSSTSWSWEL